MNSFFDELWSKIKTHVIYILIICILTTFLSISVSRCTDASDEYKHNIEVLNDTIKYYQDKNGNLVATKLAFESDINTLKLLNKNLYSQIDSLKLSKNSVAQIIYVDGTIENPQKDSSYIVHHDTISKGFSKDFNFNDKYRILEGNINYRNDSLGIHIDKDIINFDYTVAMDKDSRIYIKSTNPYVKYNEISGFTINQRKRPKTTFVIGPSVGYGYNFNSKQFGLTIGINATWGINLGK